MYMSNRNNIAPRIVSPSRSGFGRSNSRYVDVDHSGYNSGHGLRPNGPRFRSPPVPVTKMYEAKNDDDDDDESDDDEKDLEYCKKVLKKNGKEIKDSRDSKGKKFRRELSSYIRSGRDTKGESIKDKYRRSKDKFTKKLSDWVYPEGKSESRAPYYGLDYYNRFGREKPNGFYNSTGNVGNIGSRGNRGSRYRSLSRSPYSSANVSDSSNSPVRGFHDKEGYYSSRKFAGGRRFYASNDHDDLLNFINKRVNKLEDKLERVLDKLEEKSKN